MSVFQIALSSGRRRLSAGEADDGFTLIELLTVVLIIGVLAAIAIPVYLGIQVSAKNASVQTDLADAKIAVINVQTSTGDWPATAADVSAVVTHKDGYTRGANTGVIKYVKGSGVPYKFCLSTTMIGGGPTFFVTDATGVKQVGTTAPAVALPSGC